MSQCTDRSVGILLHAYELGILDDEQVDRFHLHVLKCDYCSAELQAFDQYAGALLADERARSLVERTVREEVDLSLPKKLVRLFWPPRPLRLKPAIPYLVILALLFPAYFGLRSITEDGIRPVQMIRLNQLRDSQHNVFTSGKGLDGVITFALPRQKAGDECSIIIKARDDKTIFHSKKPIAVDEYGMAEVLFPAEEMKPGVYRLLVYCPAAEGQAVSDTVEYRFVVSEQ